MAEMGLTLTCPSFLQGGPISATHTCDGKNISPELHWSHAPPDTGSFVLIMEDLDASDGTLTHWVLFDIPGSAEGLSEKEESIGVAGRNDFHYEGYAGPCPPPRYGAHRYVLRLYALDVASLGLQRGATRREVEHAMRDHGLEHAELMGRYERR
jgi:Raf kinase inhibitor-like YbhB/YbcL family protein